MKSKRQQEILDIISSYEIETQEQLLERLRERGIETTQATVSRDIKQLHLVKERPCQRRGGDPGQHGYPRAGRLPGGGQHHHPHHADQRIGGGVLQGDPGDAGLTEAGSQNHAFGRRRERDALRSSH